LSTTNGARTSFLKGPRDTGCARAESTCHAVKLFFRRRFRNAPRGVVAHSCCFFTKRAPRGIVRFTRPSLRRHTHTKSSYIQPDARAPSNSNSRVDSGPKRARFVHETSCRRLRQKKNHVVRAAVNRSRADRSERDENTTRNNNIRRRTQWATARRTNKFELFQFGFFPPRLFNPSGAWSPSDPNGLIFDRNNRPNTLRTEYRIITKK